MVRFSYSVRSEVQKERSVAAMERENCFPWYVVRTRANFENLAAIALSNLGLETYLPVYRTQRKRTDHMAFNDVPLFEGYVFCRFAMTDRFAVLNTPGVIGIVSQGVEPALLDEKQLWVVQAVLRSGLAIEPCPLVEDGQPVRILRGPLGGIEGSLTKKKADFYLVVSVPILQRAVSVAIDPQWIRVV